MKAISHFQKIVVFCPLPPKPNGIADYFAEQIPYFSKYCEMTIVIEDCHPKPIGIAGYVSIIRMSEYLQRREAYSEHKHVYHVGNNHDTPYMLPVLLSTPGVVIIHDLNLHHLIDLTTLGQGSKLGYTSALFYQYGRLGGIIGNQLSEYHLKGSFSPSELELNASIIDSAEQVIVHSEYSALRVRARGQNNVSVIPHHIAPNVANYPRKLKQCYREQLGLPVDKLIFTSMGFIAKAKQIKAVLNSLVELKKQGVDFLYVLAGQCKVHEYDVFSEIAASGLENQVIVTGFLNEESFYQHLGATDLVINLRYPTGGESSGTLTRALGLGLCCIVVDIGPFAELPSDVAVKLDYDENFADTLTNTLIDLANDDNKRTQIGLKAKQWIEQTHRIAVTTELYMECFAKTSTPSKMNAVLFAEQLNYTCRNYLPKLINQMQLVEIMNDIPKQKASLVWTEALMPLSDDDGLCVTIGASELDFKLLTQLNHYSRSQMVSFSIDEDFVFKTKNMWAVANTLFVNLPLQYLVDDPVYIFALLNGLSKLGSTFILTIELPENLPESCVSLNPSDISEYLCAAGFIVESQITGDNTVDFAQDVAASMQTNWAFSGQVWSRMIDRFPMPFYPVNESKCILLSEEVMKQLEPSTELDFLMEPIR